MTVTVPVTRPTAATAAIVTVDRTRAAMRRTKRRRRRRVRRKHPAAIAAQRDKPRVRKEHLLTGASHRVRRLLTSGQRKTPAINDKQRPRGEGAGAESVGERT